MPPGVRFGVMKSRSRGLLLVAPLLMKVVSPLILLVVGVHTKCDVTVTVAAPADANVAADNASPAAAASAAVRRLIAGRCLPVLLLNSFLICPLRWFRRRARPTSAGTTSG